MLPLKTFLKPGVVIGEGVRAYTVEKVTAESVYLRGHPDAQRGERENRNGALRIIPAIVIEDILHGLETKRIQMDDIMRRRGDEKAEDLFSMLGVDHDKFILGYDSTIYKICELYLDSSQNSNLLKDSARLSNSLPKPFLLLAGISGTGKTRFVREQAAASRRSGTVTNYSLIPVRPDWHEPSDLLGYVSRIGANGSARYVVTDLLKFVVQAWLDAAALSATSIDELPCKSPDEMTPFWLCLDEMNLAPVEQYFADYLSVVETRKWVGENYTCDPLLKAATIEQLDDDGRLALRKDLKLDDVQFDGLWAYFLKVGIPLPPNLIVAGTVNMDETTHGFSRKVIDRAFTIYFGVFYPNDFAEFFEEDKVNFAKTLGFPLLSSASKAELAGVVADAGGVRSIAFWGAINAVLRGSPFELAYRALNELLLALVCFNPKDEAELQAVWDDFLMSKVLPRIDGDAEKLGVENNASLLTRLRDEIAKQFVGKADMRPDLLREGKDGGVCAVGWRAEQKLNWMQTRLDANGFTTFWP
jgi:hypothetical protein